MKFIGHITVELYIIVSPTAPAALEVTLNDAGEHGLLSVLARKSQHKPPTDFHEHVNAGCSASAGPSTNDSEIIRVD